jgi:hypothetical protein
VEVQVRATRRAYLLGMNPLGMDLYVSHYSPVLAAPLPTGPLGVVYRLTGFVLALLFLAGVGNLAYMAFTERSDKHCWVMDQNDGDPEYFDYSKPGCGKGGD